VTVRERWFGATGRRVPEIAIDGSVDVAGAVVLASVTDVAALAAAHERGTPVVVRAATRDDVIAALARPEVACVLVPDEELLRLDLAELTYGD